MSNFAADVVHLIGDMVETFQRKKRGKKITVRIERGRASASSSDFEEGLAKLIQEHTPKDIKIWVDCPISYRLRSSRRAKTIYPDIALVRNNSLIAILEAKIDLGYLPANWARSRKQTLRQLMSVGRVTLDERTLAVSERLRTACVVLTARNHPERLPGFLKEVKNVVILLSKEHSHPNDEIDRANRKAYIVKIKNDGIHRRQWRKLEQFVRSIANTK